MAIYFQIQYKTVGTYYRYCCSYREGPYPGYTLWEHNQYQDKYNYLTYELVLTDGKFVCPEYCTGMFSFADSNMSAQVTITNWEYIDTSNVTNMEQMFYHASIRYLDFSILDTSKVTNMGGMFKEAVSTTNPTWDGKMNLSTWDVSKVTNMVDMFHACIGLTRLDITGWDISNVTNMDRMFSQCSVSGPVLAGDNIAWDRMCNASSDMMFNNSSSNKGKIVGGLSKASTRPDGYFYGGWIGFWDKYIPYLNSEGWENLDIYLKDNDNWTKCDIFQKD